MLIQFTLPEAVHLPPSLLTLELLPRELLQPDVEEGRFCPLGPRFQNLRMYGHCVLGSYLQTLEMYLKREIPFLLF